MNSLDRLAAWIITGPLGHFWSATADIAALWTRYAWSRVVSRDVRWRHRRKS